MVRHPREQGRLGHRPDQVLERMRGHHDQAEALSEIDRRGVADMPVDQPCRIEQPGARDHRPGQIEPNDPMPVGREHAGEPARAAGQVQDRPAGLGRERPVEIIVRPPAILGVIERGIVIFAVETARHGAGKASVG